MSLRHMCDGCGYVEKQRTLLAIPNGWIHVDIKKNIPGTSMIKGEFHNLECLISYLAVKATEVKEPT